MEVQIGKTQQFLYELKKTIDELAASKTQWEVRRRGSIQVYGIFKKSYGIFLDSLEFTRNLTVFVFTLVSNALSEILSASNKTMNDLLINSKGQSLIFLLLSLLGAYLLGLATQSLVVLLKEVSLLANRLCCAPLRDYANRFRTLLGLPALENNSPPYSMFLASLENVSSVLLSIGYPVEYLANCLRGAQQSNDSLNSEESIKRLGDVIVGRLEDRINQASGEMSAAICATTTHNVLAELAPLLGGVQDALNKSGHLLSANVTVPLQETLILLEQSLTRTIGMTGDACVQTSAEVAGAVINLRKTTDDHFVTILNESDKNFRNCTRELSEISSHLHQHKDNISDLLLSLSEGIEHGMKQIDARLQIATL